MIISDAATWGHGGVDEQGGGAQEPGKRGRRMKQIMLNDVRRAYVNAPCTRLLYIELPDEDPLKIAGMVGRLNLSLYGTRDDALNWQETFSEHLAQCGFIKGRGHPSVFYHPKRQLRTLVHGG